MLNKIILKNWQKHDFLELDFNPNINVITGLTDTGKSCIFRAMEWVCGVSDTSEKDYRREGTNETSVKMFLNNGYQVEKIRSDSLNRYILSKDGIDQVFDAVNKDVPDEIRKVLPIENIEIDGQSINLNFASQANLNFIFDENIKASFRSKLFNKFTGNEFIDKLFKHLNKESLSLSKKIKASENTLSIQEKELVTLKKESEDLSNVLTIVKDLQSELNGNMEIYQILSDLVEQKLKSDTELKETQEKLQNVILVNAETIIKTKELIDKYSNILSLKSKFDEISKNIDQLLQTKIQTVEVNWNELKEKVNQYYAIQDLNSLYSSTSKQIDEILSKNDRIKLNDLTELKMLSQKYIQISDKILELNNCNLFIDNILQEINKTEGQIAESKKEIQDFWDSTDICPLCHQKKCNHE